MFLYRNSLGLVLLFLLTLIMSCDSPVTLRAPQSTPSVSYQVCVFDSLLQNRPRFVGAPVEVQGIFRYHFEDVSLHPATATAPSKALWIDFTPGLLREAPTGVDSLELCNGRQVRVRGRFSNAKGHLGQYAGTLEDVVFLACE